MPKITEPSRPSLLQHQFPLHGGLGIIVSNNDGLEGSVIFGILKRADDGLSRQPMANRVTARSLPALFRNWTSAFLRVATVCLNLPNGGHRAPPAAIGFVLLISLPLRTGGSFLISIRS